MGPGALFDQINANGYAITRDECSKLFFKYMNTFATAIKWLKDSQRYASTHFRSSNMNGRTRHWFKPDREKIELAIRLELEKKGTLDNYSALKIAELVRDKTKGQIAGIEREGANFRIQSVNADFMKVAMHRLRKKYKEMGWGPNTSKGTRTYNMVYDELVLDFHKDFAEEGFEIQKQIMIEAAHEMLKKVPMEVEGHLDSKWVK